MALADEKRKFWEALDDEQKAFIREIVETFDASYHGPDIEGTQADPFPKPLREEKCS